MNTILQNRIEEAAKNLINYNLVDLGDLVNQYDLRRMLIEIGVKVLQNQWISVEEALPVLVGKNSGKSEVVFATTDYHYNIFVAYYDYSNDTWYYNNYPGYDPKIYYEVTHWMPIPSLKGGRK